MWVAAAQVASAYQTSHATICFCLCRRAGKRGLRLIGAQHPGKRNGKRTGSGRSLLGPDGASYRPYYSSIGRACPSAGFTGDFPVISGEMGELVWDGRVCANQPSGTVRRERRKS